MKKKLIILTIMSLVILLLAFSYTKASFVYNQIWNYYLNSKGFYFTSDYSVEDNIYNFWDGSSIAFNIKNNDGDNYDVDDLYFDVKCIVPEGSSCTLSKNSSIIQGGSAGSDTILFNLDTELNDINVIIEASSTKPYKKKIRLNFILHRATTELGSIDYNVVDYGNYSLLNISNYYDSNKCMVVRWNNTDVRVLDDDIYNIATDSSGYINEFNIYVLKNRTSSVKVYSIGNNEITRDIFYVTECSVIAE